MLAVKNFLNKNQGVFVVGLGLTAGAVVMFDYRNSKAGQKISDHPPLELVPNSVNQEDDMETIMQTLGASK